VPECKCRGERLRISTGREAGARREKALRRKCDSFRFGAKLMKKIALLGLIPFAAFSLTLHAQDVKITGEAMCAKCELMQTAACQMAIKYKNAAGKEETILAENNKVAKDFHDEICKKNAKVEAEGKITEKDGEKTITLTKIKTAN
jgi:hypothetical protein